MKAFFELNLTDVIITVFTIIGLSFAYFQWIDVRKHKRMEFTYQIYRDFFNYLNDDKNADLKNWLFGVKADNIDHTKIGDLLEQFEIIWSLQKKQLVEEDTIYDLFGFYILKVNAAQFPSAYEYIHELRLKEKDIQNYTDDIFIGYENLVEQMLKKKNNYSFSKRISK